MTNTRRTFAVVTDSASDIPPARAAELGVGVVPLPVTVGGETFDDGSLSQEELFRRIAESPSPPTTSQPSPAALMRAYESALELADEVIGVHISSQLSGTVNVARLVSREFGGRVHVFDSRNLSWGLGWQVVEAAEAATAGKDVTEGLRRIERAREAAKIVVTLDSLEALHRSGRIGAVAKHVGSMLDLKVSVAVNPAGSFTPVRGNRGDGSALRAMLSWIANHMDGAEGGRFAVGHALAPELADPLAEQIRKRWRVDELVLYKTGAAISVHAGRIWGVAFRPVR